MKWFKISFDKSDHSYICGLGIQIGQWRKAWRVPELSPLHLWIYIFPREKLYPPHLIHNFDDREIPSDVYPDYIGIGMSFPHKGKMAKVAVRFENDVTGEELKRGIKKLAESVAKPEEPDSGVVFGNGRLTENEIIIREGK